MKYLVIEIDGLEVPIIFSDLLEHRQVASKLGETYPVVSAGTFLLSQDGVTAYGESISLRITSRPEDRDLISTELRRK